MVLLMQNSCPDGRFELHRLPSAASRCALANTQCKGGAVCKKVEIQELTDTTSRNFVTFFGNHGKVEPLGGDSWQSTEPWWLHHQGIAIGHPSVAHRYK